MPSLEEYFEQNRYKPKWFIGDRVEGKWNGIPFVGSVGNDRIVNENNGPEITVHLDLPIKFEDKVHYIIITKHKDVVRLK